MSRGEGIIACSGAIIVAVFYFWGFVAAVCAAGLLLGAALIEGL